jgi:hypothetical protein
MEAKMSRKRKEVITEAPIEVSVEVVKDPVVAAEEVCAEPAPVLSVSSVNIDELKALVWKNDLEAMQEAVAVIQGDKLTMNAVNSVLTAKTAGIAAQYLQQIIQRNG